MSGLEGTFKEAWSVAIARVGAVEEEAGRVLGRLAGAAGLSQEDLRRYAREVEQRLDDALRRASLLLPPNHMELASMSKRLDVLAERIAKLERQEEA